MLRTLALLSILLPTACRAPSSTEKKPLETYLEESGLYEDFLCDAELARLRTLHAAVTAEDLARTEPPLREELASTRSAMKVFLHWRVAPEKARKEHARDPKAFAAEWTRLGSFIASPLLAKLREDARIEQKDGEWFTDLKKYVCAKNPEACPKP